MRSSTMTVASGGGAVTYAESQLIGSILSEEDEKVGTIGEDNAHHDTNNHTTNSNDELFLGVEEPYDDTIMVGGEIVATNDPRLSPEYYAYYYLQQPLDPRLPPPLVPTEAELAAYRNNANNVNPMLAIMGFGALNDTPNPSSSASPANHISPSLPDASVSLSPSVASTSNQSSANIFNNDQHIIDSHSSITSLSDQWSNFEISNDMDINTLRMNTLSLSDQFQRSISADIHLSPPRLSDDVSDLYQPSLENQHAISSSSTIPTNPLSYTTDMESSVDTNTAWLADFRLNRNNPSLTLMDIVSRGLMVNLATDQYGSRFIQMRLESCSLQDKNAAFEQILPEILQLCTDVFGNYVIQKFLELSSAQKRYLICQGLGGHICELSLHMYGCRVIQKALEVLDPKYQEIILSELRPHVLECVKDQNGNHVIQKCVEKCPSYSIQFIIDRFKGNCASLATHPFGCRIIQRMFEHSLDEQRETLVTEILGNASDLSTKQYGNYVIQHLLIHGTAQHRRAIITGLKGKVVSLSKHKFASNVVEKCLTHASKSDRDALVEEILGKPSTTPTDKLHEASNRALLSMIKDQYANYVVQKLIDILEADQLTYLVMRLQRYVSQLRKIPYGRHIIGRLEKLTGNPI